MGQGLGLSEVYLGLMGIFGDILRMIIGDGTLLRDLLRSGPNQICNCRGGGIFKKTTNKSVLTILDQVPCYACGINE